MIGELLGKYRILSQLGEGGMGVVYIGRHETLGNSVVVKVLQPDLSRNVEMVQRFFKEAQAATAIRDLGIVQVFDFGTAPDGRAYFVMELLEGQSLAARLKQQRLGYGESCRIGRQIANVLHAAHARGITHRDLKPDNLFLVPDAEAMGGERIKVLDFGIAKLASDAHASGVKTRTGLIMGTPHYMSPEQCRGAGTVDSRTDIYALGCILFEMTCGRPPFVGEGAGQILGAHQYLDAPQPRHFAPDMPVDLSALIERMLAKHPDARPQTMAAVSLALAEILQALGVSLRAPTPLPVASSIGSSGRASGSSHEQPISAPTTLGGSAGMAVVRAGTPAHRYMLGGLLIAGVATTLVLVFGPGDSDSPARPVADDTVMLQPADAGVPDAPQLAVDAPEVVPDAAEIRAAPPGAAPVQSRQIAAECLLYQTDQKWRELELCAERLKEADPLAAKGFKDRAAFESMVQQRIAAFKAAIEIRNLKRARTELDAIPNTVVGYSEFRQKYNDAENTAIRELTVRLRQVSTGDCKEYEQILQQEQSSRPSRVTAEAARQVECTPSPVVTSSMTSSCDEEDLARRGNALYASGKLVDAIASYEAAWDCKQDILYAEKAFIIACGIPSIIKSKLFWKRMSPPMRQRALVICLRNGITEETLDAP